MFSNDATNSVQIKKTKNCRKPAVAGQFYPDNAQELTSLIKHLFASSRTCQVSQVKAIIVPHAGYIYSGEVAASAYLTLIPQMHKIKRVILLGPSHRVGFHGIATTSVNYFNTPLGDIPIDKAAINIIESLPQLISLDRAHAHEHSLEVQLPFLQNLLDEFTLVPLVVGDCNSQQVSEVLELLWGGDETLIVISSDLSHYHSYDDAVQQDRKTSESIVNMQPEKIEFDDACGRIPIKGLLLSASLHNLKVQQVDLRNSGDTAGTRDRVVGYGAYIFSL
jgi:MEMO1 family protein